MRKGHFMIIIQSIDEMLSEIEQLQSNFYGLKNVIYSAVELLSERESYDLDIVANWLDNQLVIYQEEQIDECIELAKVEVKNNPECYSIFFYSVDCEDPFIDPKLDNIFSYFELPNYESEWIEKYKFLEQLLNRKKLEDFEVPTLPNAKDYELMAILALSYVKNALYFNHYEQQKEIYEKYESIHQHNYLHEFLSLRRELGMREIISAFISIDKAKSLKNKVCITELEDTIRKKF